ncbi:hypothetical protein C8R46DRAFT_1186831 [Mycena filopes]|nr:hypothetical protein C8R46DRAFT_1186831 [Mycena filopes]
MPEFKPEPEVEPWECGAKAVPRTERLISMTHDLHWGVNGPAEKSARDRITPGVTTLFGQYYCYATYPVGPTNQQPPPEPFSTPPIPKNNDFETSHSQRYPRWSSPSSSPALQPCSTFVRICGRRLAGPRYPCHRTFDEHLGRFGGEKYKRFGVPGTRSHLGGEPKRFGVPGTRPHFGGGPKRRGVPGIQPHFGGGAVAQRCKR